MPTYTIEINEAQRAHFRAPFGKAAREALARLREHDGGTRYNGDDDDAGERACCLVASWKPHDSDCPHAVAVAEFDRLLAALDADKENDND